MDLRPRRREAFSGFTKPEVQKMKQLLDVFKDEPITEELYKKLARVFSRSTGRAGKPVVKWTEIQSWFHQNQQQGSCKESSSSEANNLTATPETVNQNKATSDHKMPAGMENVDIPRLEFEAKSSKDGAWYDVDAFLSHRPLISGDIEVYVKYVGFGEEENEWVNSRLVRVRSVALEHSECHKVKVGDLVVCFQESQNQARYYDAYVLEIQRRWHDIRGCRCLFLVRYEHDKEEEKVRLRRLCCRPKRLLMST